MPGLLLVENLHRTCGIEATRRGYGRREEEVRGKYPDQKGRYGFSFFGRVGGRWGRGVNVKFAEAGVVD